ncbi:MAG: hypothetical protein Q9M08_03790, partial [Mariprofundus sp.]|nr:hypothetical protein [Mariprofundus sp.]
LMSVAMFYTNRSATQTSSGAQNSTEAYYYAESAVNYIAWALINDAEFDNYKSYSGSYIAAPFGEPLVPANPAPLGDFSEFMAYLWHPGPTGAAGSKAVDTLATAYTDGQLMYFDNSPMASRSLCMQSATSFSNCVDITVAPAKRVEPSMYRISSKLPRYIKLDIAADGTITPSIPKLPHHVNPVVGEDIPNNGAIVWLTAADPNNFDHDIEIFPLDPDPANPYGGTLPSACVGNTLPNCPCNSAHELVNDKFSTAQACDANTGLWLPNYSIVAYAVGYVNGKPSHMLRSVIKIK